MPKTISTDEKRRTGKASPAGKVKAAPVAKAINRNAVTGQFVLGRKAFASISAVEGVYLSKIMAADFKRLDHVSSSERRQALTVKYGKK